METVGKIERLRGWYIAALLVAIGLSVFAWSLGNGFVGDDSSQIVDNVAVHSISNVKSFFSGSTFYNGQGNASLAGVYFRPLMTTVFSVIYTIFGAKPAAFHIVQLALFLGSVVLLFYILKLAINQTIALVFALLFLLHPINSQIVYSIASMQDVLFIFFGLLAFLLLLKTGSKRSLVFVVASLFMALLAKEAGLMFVIMCLLYVALFDRRRLYAFLATLVGPLVLYAILRIHAVGLLHSVHIAPISSLSLGERLLTIPSVLCLYITKLFVPIHQASSYYWTNPTFSFKTFVIPLLVDLVIITGVVYVGVLLKRAAPKSRFFVYVFFAVWAVLGLLVVSQIAPLDMTACESWFVFPFIGLIGMACVALDVFVQRKHLLVLLVIVIALSAVFGGLTIARGGDWKSDNALAYSDIVHDKSNYVSYYVVSNDQLDKGNVSDALAYAKKSVDIYPSLNGYNALGLAYTNQLKFADAAKAYDSGIRLGDYYLLYENRGSLTMVQGDPAANKKFLVGAVSKFSGDSSLWLYLAILDARYYSKDDAKYAINQAAAYGQVPEPIIDSITNNKPLKLTVNVGGTPEIINIP